ncbi:hypothetical protein BT96DRAFT_1071446 [Gymnopus androsaceus JB14]|uniref:DUF6593 domain-containing protein n=1 Tax=Gymnopus androsaceus JB14 TaxID=1447944 RepID=A0A6A4I1N0_9AGAR|nr:hypothetical protein BT96DRAFT_1071446 [Gymnopus androsaceus JB14]
MDAYFNPFAGWSQAGQGGSALRDINNGIAPSTFGALPYGQPPPAANLITFEISSFSPDILNCTVTGPNRQRYLRVVTDPENPTYTLFQKSQGRNCALVEWQRQPLVEIRDVMSKYPVRDWLRLNSDRRARTMQFQSVRYTWAPQDNYINMYTTGSNPEFLARISRGHGTIMLDLTNQAIQLGLLDACIIATVIMQCGRSID